ncbi:hypothetical protein OKW21_003842 [Catalinimonas alkaloidigena]|nr:hypothetical protein [Catalinimonas alkaloidigena]
MLGRSAFLRQIKITNNKIHYKNQTKSTFRMQSW